MGMQNIGRKLDQRSLNKDQVNYAHSRTTLGHAKIYIMLIEDIFKRYRRNILIEN
jgi:hypothetical protein